MILIRKLLKSKKKVVPARDLSCIDLTQLRTQRKKKVKYSDGVTAINSKWYIVNGREALFKPEDKNGSEFKWNEMVCSLLAKQVGIPCAEYDFAVHKKLGAGVISYNFLKENQRTMTGYELLLTAHSKYKIHNKDKNTYENYVRTLTGLQATGKFKIDVDSCAGHLFETMLFDFLTGNEDRHNTNVAFILQNDKKTKEKTILPCPIFDNERTFRKDRFLPVNEGGRTLFEALSRQLLYPFDETKLYDSNEYLTDLVKCCISSKKNLQITDRILENLDIKKVEDQLDKMGHPLTEEQKENYENFITFKKQSLEKELDKQLSSEKYLSELL